MRKLAKLLAILGFGFGVVVSWAKTPDQKASVRSRLTQSIGIKGKGVTSTNLKMSVTDTSNRIIRTPTSTKPKAEAAKEGEEKSDKPAAQTEITIPAGIDMFTTPAAIFGKNGHDDSAQGRSSLIGDPGALDQNGNPGGDRIVSDENAPAANPADFGGGDKDKNKNSGGNQAPQGVTPKMISGGDASVKGTAKKLDKWWPVCAFIDQGIDEKTANEAMKGMVQKAAECNVKIEVFPVQVSNWGTTDELDADTINKLSVEKCNVPGKVAASATALVPPAWKYTAAVMCGDFQAKKPGKHIKDGQEGEWNENVAGCAQLRTGTKLDQDYLDANAKPSAPGGHKHSSKAADGEVAPSIEVAKGQNANVVSHEALGHSQMGKPNGSRYGLGIGEEEDMRPDANGRIAGDAMTDSWTKPAGCNVMYEKAHGDAEWERAFGGSPPMYDSSRETYYKPGGYLYDMAGSPALFDERNPVPPPGPMLAKVPPTQTGGGVARQQPPTKTGDDAVAAMTVGEPGPYEAEPTKHKKGSSAAIPEIAGNTSLRKKPELKGDSKSIPETVPNAQVAAVIPENGGPALPNKRTVYVDDAPSVGTGGFGKQSKGTISDEPYDVNAISTSVANATGGGGRSGGRVELQDDAEGVAPGAGAMDSGPSTAPTSSGFGTDQLAMGDSGFPIGGSGSISAPTGKNSLSGQEEFFYSVDGKEDETANPQGARRRPASTGRRAPRAQRNGSAEVYRPPTSIYGDPVL